MTKQPHLLAQATLVRGVGRRGVCLASAAAPAARAHRARLSADLTDHLAAGSQTIRVIVHGDAAEVDALATRYNLPVEALPDERRGAAVNAGQLAALRGRTTRGSSVGRRPDQVERGRRDGGEHRRRSGVGGRRRVPALIGPGRHGGGDRFGDRHAAQRAQGGA